MTSKSNSSSQKSHWKKIEHDFDQCNIYGNIGGVDFVGTIYLDGKSSYAKILIKGFKNFKDIREFHTRNLYFDFAAHADRIPFLFFRDCFIFSIPMMSSFHAPNFISEIFELKIFFNTLLLTNQPINRNTLYDQLSFQVEGLDLLFPNPEQIMEIGERSILKKSNKVQMWGSQNRPIAMQIFTSPRKKYRIFTEWGTLEAKWTLNLNSDIKGNTANTEKLIFVVSAHYPNTMTGLQNLANMFCQFITLFTQKAAIIESQTFLIRRQEKIEQKVHMYHVPDIGEDHSNRIEISPIRLNFGTTSGSIDEFFNLYKDWTLNHCDREIFRMRVSRNIKETKNFISFDQILDFSVAAESIDFDELQLEIHKTLRDKAAKAAAEILANDMIDDLEGRLKGLIGNLNQPPIRQKVERILLHSGIISVESAKEISRKLNILRAGVAHKLSRKNTLSTDIQILYPLLSAAFAYFDIASSSSKQQRNHFLFHLKKIIYDLTARI